MAGKGDKPRPINKNQFDLNYDFIQWYPKINVKKPIKHIKIKNGKATRYIYS